MDLAPCHMTVIGDLFSSVHYIGSTTKMHLIQAMRQFPLALKSKENTLDDRGKNLLLPVLRRR